jgi:hypothetical protein
MRTAGPGAGGRVGGGAPAIAGSADPGRIGPCLAGAVAGLAGRLSLALAATLAGRPAGAKDGPDRARALAQRRMAASRRQRRRGAGCERATPARHRALARPAGRNRHPVSAQRQRALVLGLRRQRSDRPQAGQTHGGGHHAGNPRMGRRRFAGLGPSARRTEEERKRHRQRGGFGRGSQLQSHAARRPAQFRGVVPRRAQHRQRRRVSLLRQLRRRRLPVHRRLQGLRTHRGQHPRRRLRPHPLGRRRHRVEGRRALVRSPSRRGQQPQRRRLLRPFVADARAAQGLGLRAANRLRALAVCRGCGAGRGLRRAGRRLLVRRGRHDQLQRVDALPDALRGQRQDQGPRQAAMGFRRRHDRHGSQPAARLFQERQVHGDAAVGRRLAGAPPRGARLGDPDAHQPAVAAQSHSGVVRHGLEEAGLPAAKPALRVSHALRATPARAADGSRIAADALAKGSGPATACDLIRRAVRGARVARAGARGDQAFRNRR